MNIVLFEPGEEVGLLPRDDPRGTHILRILRSVAGDVIRCGTVGGGRFSARIVSTGDDGIVLERVAGSEEDPPAPVPLRIAVGHPRPPVLQRLFRDLSSFGVARIAVFHGELSEKSYFSSSLWKNPRRFLLDGAMQGGITTLPEVEVFGSVGHLIQTLPDREFLIAADTPAGCGDGDGTYTISEMDEIVAHRSTGNVSVLVGPERGFSSGERALFSRVPRLRLGETVFRTETAAVVAAAVITQALRKRTVDERSGS